MSRKSESGFTHIVLLVLALAVVCAVIFVGLRVMQNQNTGENSTTSSAPVVTNTAPGTINNAADLNATKTALNQDNVDNDLNPDSLNSDISGLL
jgi:flagellar basal body-associated protein FliL